MIKIVKEPTSLGLTKVIGDHANSTHYSITSSPSGWDKITYYTDNNTQLSSIENKAVDVSLIEESRLLDVLNYVMDRSEGEEHLIEAFELAIGRKLNKDDVHGW